MISSTSRRTPAATAASAAPAFRAGLESSSAVKLRGGMTTRRQFLLAGMLGVLGSRHSAAQQRVPRIGMLAGAPVDRSLLASMLLKELAELGYRRDAGM